MAINDSYFGSSSWIFRLQSFNALDAHHDFERIFTSGVNALACLTQSLLQLIGRYSHDWINGFEKPKGNFIRRGRQTVFTRAALGITRRFCQQVFA